ncbi:hypothetical protein GOZ81_12710 [Agrobacterium vitis]|uniref:hypothetical protein n=1 Tax=Agrobacterium vitis TaxID=373 RepID=UPI0012E778D8|nr:hypothetical protein [Agrobacterium vitis]MVA71936.1 hypothetical protein [Agrobacterium vitis]
MTSPLQPSVGFPVTLREWERMLTSALLRAEDGNADPIRSFEITPESLAFFCGHAPEHAAEAERAFRRALVSYPDLPWRLQHGSFRTAGSEAPECMAILALSLLVDSLLDGEYGGTNEYRAKLRQWLGIDRSFMVLRGIHAMWEELAAWLEARVAEGAPFRRLILPDIPEKWTHIGYARYLSFPTRRDLRFLQKQIRRSPKLANDPAGLVRLLDPEIGTPAVSFGLKKAFADFRAALRSGRASVDHRFWRLVEQARSAAGEQTAPLSELRMEFDEDGRRQYRLSGQSARMYFPRDIGVATTHNVLLDSPNLGPGARRGILFFQSIGLASWTATGQPPLGAGEYHVAVAARYERLASSAIVGWESSGGWLVTKSSVSTGTVGDILRRLGIRNAQENLLSVGIVDGVHVGSCWLGAPRLLPRLEGTTGAIEVSRIGDAPDVGLRALSGRLTANDTVDGRYVFSDTVGAWSRHAAFVACAEVHGDLSGAAYTLPIHSEWQSVGSARGGGSADAEIKWDDRSYAYQDIIEGIYASSKSGISEGDAVALIDRVAGRRSWDFLRTLVEATFLDERLRLRWRGRIFTLGHARLEQMIIGRSDGVIVSGAVPARLEDDFRRTVSLQGGKAFRRLSAGFGPPIIGAVDVDARNLARALGWIVTDVATLPTGRVDESLVETGVIGESYLVGSHWDWMLGRFRVDGVAAGPVTLTRLVHPGGRDHDLYRVVGKHTHNFTSRHSAILNAYAQSGIPMFERIDGEVRRVTLEGALPIEIARALRGLAISNGGACTQGWSYHVGPRDEAWLARLLPGLILGITATRKIGADGLSLRGRGARRAMWIDGDIVA